MTRRQTAFAVLALVAMIIPSFAQGEGNGLATLTTAVNAGTNDANDKAINNGDLLTMTLTSTTGVGGFPIYAAGRINCFAPQPSFDFGAEMGVVGLNLMGEANVIFDGASLVPQAILGPTQTMTLYVVIPAGALANGFSDLMVQAACTDATGLQGYAVANSVRHIGPVAGVFADTCFEALCSPGLSDADLGMPFSVDTNMFTDNVTTSGLSGFGTQSVFMVQPPGMGSGSSTGTARDVFVKFTATAGGAYTFDFCASTYDSRIWLMPTTCTLPVAGIVHNDDASADTGGACVMPGHTLASRLRSVCLNPGQVVLLVIDGFGGNNGVANFTIYRPTPSITTVTPSSGFSNCPTNVTITGGGFDVNATVTFGGMAGSIVSQTCNSIVVTPPVGLSGAVDVVVSNPMSMNSAMATGAYTGNTAIVISSITPNLSSPLCGMPPATITINGGNFVAPSSVDFGGNAASVVVESCTQIVVTNPMLADGVYNVTVTRPDMMSTTAMNAFTFSSATSIVTNFPGNTLGDDGSIAYNILCGSFVFYGQSYTTFRVCANTRIQFGTNGNSDFTETTAKLLTQSPSINLFWDDSDPRTSASPAGSITVTETATTVTISFQNIRRRTAAEGFSSGTITLDRNTGEITLSYGAVNTRGCLVGIAPGTGVSGVLEPEQDFSVATSYMAASAVGAIYEIFTPTGTSPAFVGDITDIGTLTFGFTPTGGNGVGPYLFHRP